jgi:NAD-dependent deacetylase
MWDSLKKLSDLLSISNSIVVITGAGISTNAGIPDFRGPNGLYHRKDIPAEKLFDIDYFLKDPELFYRYIGTLWDSFVSAVPTITHEFLALLEHNGKIHTIITQNIDGLHRKAGSKNVIPAHGDFTMFVCLACRKTFTDIALIREQIGQGNVPLCRCGGVLKPCVVFFGESIIGMDESIDAVHAADCIVAIGTSLVVHPIASLPRMRKSGVPLIIINKGETGYDHEADLKIEDDIDQVFIKIRQSM